MLDEFLTMNVFHLMLIFVRVGTAIMFFPGFSAVYVSSRARLVLAFTLSILVLPVISPMLPPIPTVAADYVRLFVFEATIGDFLGALVNFITAALHLAGTAIGYASGLMNAMVFDPISAQQGAMIIALLSFVALVLIFLTGLHGVMLAAVIDSYSLFPVGAAPMSNDLMTTLRDTLNQSFHLGLQLASPFIVFAMVFQVAMGILSRLAPQWQIFFVALPLQIIFGLALMMLVIPTLILTYLEFMEGTLANFLAG